MAGAESRRVETILERLREQTREAHERLEGEVDLLRDDLTRADYANWLACLYAFLRPWERLVEAASPRAAALLADRRRSALIERDLAVFGLDREALRRLPMCGRLPQIDSFPRALGSMYVLEGSTLGGQVIARHVEPALGLAADRGSGYFRSGGRPVGPMWRAFQATLVEASSPETDATIIAAARETFEALYDWVCACPSLIRIPPA